MIKTCCFCWNTKQGSIASAIYAMVGRIIGAIIIIILLTKISGHNFMNEEVTETVVDAVRGLLIALLVYFLIFIMFCIFVIYGALKERRGFLLPWVITMSIEVAIEIKLLIASIVVVSIAGKGQVTGYGVYSILMLIYSIVFQIYMIICVHSHYQFLGQISSNPPPYALKL